VTSSDRLYALVTHESFRSLKLVADEWEVTLIGAHEGRHRVAGKLLDAVVATALDLAQEGKEPK